MNKLFIWIPKNAGTSVYTALNANTGMKLYMEDYHKFDNTGSVTFGHLDVKELLKMRIISKEYWENAHKFVIVRNPYTRLISLYDDYLNSKRLPPDTTLRQFISVLKHYTRKPSLINVMDFSMAASQSEWVLPGVEILRFEDVTDSNSILGYNIGHHNKVNGEDKWLSRYKDDELQMATELYYDDFTLFNYKILEHG